MFLKKAIRIMVMLLPVMFLFGIHVSFFKTENIGYITLCRIYLWILIAVTAAYFIVSRRIYARLGKAFWYAAVLAVMTAYSLVSLIFALDRVHSLDTFMYQLTGIAAAIYIAAIIRSFSDLKVFLRVLTVCYTAVVIIGVFEVYTGIYLFYPSVLAYTLKDSYGLNFPYSVFYNTNDNASFITIFAPFAFFTVIDWVSGVKGKLLAVSLATLMIFNVLCGRARNCLITIICFMVALLIICLVKKGMRRYARTIAAICCSLPIALVIIKLTELSGVSLLNKLGTISMKDHSISERLAIMVGGLKMAAAYHFMGVGVGNSVTLMPFYSKLSAINLHNMPLQILVEYGIIIFALYAAMTVLLARDFLKYRSGTQKRELFSILCFLTVLAFQIIGMQSSDTMHIYAVWMIFGIWFASVKLFYQDGTDKNVLHGFKDYMKQLKHVKYDK